MSKKSIIAIITIIALLFVAGISVGVFLSSRGETQATDGNQTTEQNQVADGVRFSSMTSTALMRRRSCPCSPSTRSLPSAHLPPCTAC